MMELRESSDPRVVEIVINGRISREEFDAVVAASESKIEQHGSVRFVEVVEKLGAVEPSVIWEDIKWGLAHIRQMDRVAIVADGKLMGLTAKVVNPFLKAEAKHFDLADIDEARRWVTE